MIASLLSALTSGIPPDGGAPVGGPGLLEVFLLTFIPVLVAVDPLGNVPIFLDLTRDQSPAERRRTVVAAMRTAAIAGAVFIFAGRPVFSFVGITQQDFQIGGGLVLLTLSLAALLGRSQWAGGSGGHAQNGVVPLGMPLVAGPAALTTLVIVVDLHARALGGRGWAMLCAGAAFALTLALTAACFLAGERISRALRESTLRALDRVVDLFLAAIAVMMIRRGLEGILAAGGG